MGIGAYRHLVTLEHPAVVLDPPTWYCSLQPAAQVSDGLAAFFIRGRFHPGIGLETQITFEGRTFQVQAVQDLDERHREIQVTAVEVVGRGTTPGGAPVFVPPTITVGPQGATIDAGASVMLTVIAVGAVPLFYQWMKDGADLPGEIHQFLDTGPLAVTTTYAVRVSNAYGSVLSAPAIVTVPSAYQARVLDDGASAYWPLGTTAEDLVAGNHGTISGGVTLNQPGVTDDGTAMVFNGTTGKITTASVAIPSAATIECWFNTAAGPVRAAFTDSGTTIGLGTSGGAKLYLSSAAGVFYGARAVTAGLWHHAAYVLTGTTVTIYLDGVLDATGAYARSGDSGAGTIGADASTFWSGALQDVAIYDRALTLAEIAAHYELRVTAPPPSPLLTDLVSYWKLDESTGTRVDSHGTNHLTDHNTVGSAAGKIGTACAFASTASQYLSYPDTNPLGDEDWTQAVWFKRASPTLDQMIFSKDAATGRSYWLESMNPLTFSCPAAGVNVSVPGMAPDLNWHYVVIWHDAAANTLNIQADGGPVTSVASAPFNITATPVHFGSRAYVGYEGYFDGLIDEVAIWRRVLTAEERTALYNGGLGLAYPFTP